MLGFPLLYFKGMRLMMFQLSGFYCKPCEPWKLACHRLGVPQEPETPEASRG